MGSAGVFKLSDVQPYTLSINNPLTWLGRLCLILFPLWSVRALLYSHLPSANKAQAEGYFVQVHQGQYYKASSRYHFFRWFSFLYYLWAFDRYDLGQFTSVNLESKALELSAEHSPWWLGRRWQRSPQPASAADHVPSPADEPARARPLSSKAALRWAAYMNLKSLGVLTGQAYRKESRQWHSDRNQALLKELDQHWARQTEAHRHWYKPSEVFATELQAAKEKSVDELSAMNEAEMFGYLGRIQRDFENICAGQESHRAGLENIRAGFKNIRSDQERLGAGFKNIRAGFKKIRADQESNRAGLERIQAGADALCQQMYASGQLQQRLATLKDPYKIKFLEVLIQRMASMASADDESNSSTPQAGRLLGPRKVHRISLC